jgi:hypothetical protein
MSTEIAGPLESGSQRQEAAHRSGRAFAVEFLGPMTMLGGIVWAILQPYRIVFFDHAGKGLYDYLIQPPLLVIVVGAFFTFAIAPGLLEDLRSADDSAG